MSGTAQEQKPLVSKEMTIGDVVQKFPHLAEVLMSHGIHCVGCGAKYFETLEMGFKGHGMSDEKIDQIVGELNDAAQQNPCEGGTVQITKVAAEKLKEILQKENKTDHALRVKVIKDGCAGHAYGLDIVKDQNDNDVVVEAHGIKLLVGPESLYFVKGAKIDYVDALQNAGFRISNPNASRSYGRGQSFK